MTLFTGYSSSGSGIKEVGKLMVAKVASVGDECKVLKGCAYAYTPSYTHSLLHSSDALEFKQNRPDGGN